MLKDTKGNDDAEPPETPAPVFAARALKSAFFGTPAFHDETVLEVQKPGLKKSSMAIDSKPKRNTFESDEPPENMSPTKRGILMTPGTAATRRKSVSFGIEAMEKKEGMVGCKALTKKRDDTPFTVKSRDAEMEDRSGDDSPSTQRSVRRVRSASLTKSLKDAQEKGRSRSRGRNSAISTDKHHRRADTAMDFSVAAPPQKSSPHEECLPGSYDETEQDITQVLDFTDKSLGHITTDINMPQSQSGKYWKAQYKNYHEEALAEMAQVLKYKDHAKNYAREKDLEAAELAKKLQREQSKVVQMENMITKLSSKHANLGPEDSADSLENIKDVAKLRAIVAEYKARVEEFRVEVEEPLVKKSSSRNILSSSHSLGDYDTNAIREELSKTRDNLHAAEKKNRRLEAENLRLAQELQASDVHVTKQRERNLKMQQSCQEEVKRKEEQLVCLRREFNELMELKRDSEELLNRRQDQVTALKQEIFTLKAARDGVLGRRDGFQEAIWDDANVPSIEHQTDQETTHRQRARSEERSPQHRRPLAANPASHLEAKTEQQSQMPSPVHSDSKLQAATKSDSSMSRASQRPLSELVNGSRTSQPETRRYLTKTQYSPMVTHFSDLSFGDLTSGLPPSEPSRAQDMSRSIRENTYQGSPSLSLFNIPSSPPKLSTPKHLSSVNLVRQKSNPELSRQGPSSSIAPSRLPVAESPRTRKKIPPERAAAAKARLEQKAAEKRRLQATGN